MISTDVVIVGGGCVGLTLALGLAQAGIPSVVIDAGPYAQPLTDAPELRVSAISGASEAIFTRLGVWQDMLDTRACEYKTMQVWEKDSFGSISFSSEQVHYPHLGHIIENKVIRNSLLKQLELHNDICSVLFGQGVDKINVGEREVLVSLVDGTPIIGQLLVAADGANSFVRQQMDMPITFWDYEHTAIVATVKTELPHQNCASQCFLPSGPLAFLPLWGQKNAQNISSIVWSTSSEQAKMLLNCTQKQFNKYLTTAFDGRLGMVQVQSERVGFELKMRYARTWIKHRVALIGDAAHTIHPLAGLGMNLGLLDAASLVQVLVENKKSRKDLGQVSNLRGFERWRKAEAQTYIAAMEGLKRLFAGSHPLKKLVRSTGLVLADSVLPAKDMIIKQAMGLTGELPELALPVVVES